MMRGCIEMVMGKRMGCNKYWKWEGNACICGVQNENAST
jgi:hypothetical protein